MSMNYIALQVAEVIQETHDSCSFEFSVPQEQSERFRYRPGQFLTTAYPLPGRLVAALLLPCRSSPFVSENLRVTVKRVADGRGSNWLCDQIRPGDRIEVLPPAGVFVPRQLDGDFLLLAGGSGVTPVLSILRSVLSQATGRVRLIYAQP